MTDTIRPALSSGQWARWSECPKFKEPDYTIDDPDWLGCHITKDGQLVLPDAPFEWCVKGHARHALAALALHGLVVDGKPVGFTRRHLEILDWAINVADNDCHMTDEQKSEYAEFRATIDALLPPEVAK